jgi:hypothetical protein
VDGFYGGGEFRALEEESAGVVVVFFGEVADVLPLMNYADGVGIVVVGGFGLELKGGAGAEGLEFFLVATVVVASNGAGLEVIGSGWLGIDGWKCRLRDRRTAGSREGAKGGGDGLAEWGCG